MPNWCYNVVNIVHSNPAMMDKLEDGANGDGVLQALIPCPAELLDGELTTSYGDADKQREVDRLREAAFQKHGYASWYDWCVENWGTKWDLCEVSIERHDEHRATLNFDTAWSPPLAAYEKLMEMGFEIEAFYYEPGMSFAGIWENGTDDLFEGIEGSKDAEDRLPDVLNEMFNISESLAEAERENEEDLTRWVKEGIAQREVQDAKL